MNYGQQLLFNGNTQNCEEILSEITRIKSIGTVAIAIKKLCLHNIEASSIPAICSSLQNFTFDELLISEDWVNTCPIDASNANCIAKLITNAGVKILDFSKNIYDTDALIIIMQHIKQSLIEKLSLRRYIIEQREADVLIDLMENSHLTCLSMTNCWFKDDSFCRIMNVRTLVHLYLSSNRFAARDVPYLHNVGIGDEEIVALIEHINEARLTGLSLSTCYFSRAHMTALLRSIQNSSLTLLRLTDVNLRKNIDQMCDAIKGSRLKKLHLVECHLNGAELAVIIGSMKNHQYLTCVSVSATATAHQKRLMVTVMCDALTCSTIKQISFENWQLEGEELAKILDAIKKSHVTRVNLVSNRFTRESIADLCQLLEGSAVQGLKLSGKFFSNSVINSMLPAIQKSSLTKLAFHYCGTASVHSRGDTMNVIKQILEENAKIAARFGKVKSSRNLAISQSRNLKN